MQPSDWQAAFTALDNAVTRNSFEVAAKVRLKDELSLALRVFDAGLYVHSRVTPISWENFVYLQSPITTPDVAANLVSLFRGPFIAHFADAEAHLSKPTALAVVGAPDALAIANSLKASLNTHVATPGLHYNDASAATIIAPDAVDNATLVALAEELRIKAPLHRSNGGQITFETIVSAETVLAAYWGALRLYNERVAAAASAFATAERVARAGAVALAYVPGLSWGVAPSYQVLLERFQALEVLPTFASDEYATSVSGQRPLCCAARHPPAMHRLGRRGRRQ
jgi:hypothetical protein